MFLMINMTSVFSVLFLVFLECILSMDNALALALCVRGLEPNQQRRALVYGVWGAFGFRALALFALKFLMGFSSWVGILGGLYLVVKALYHFTCEEPGESKPKHVSPLRFWSIVLTVELLDIAFSVDSILASVSVSRSYAIILTGAIMGILSMRLAAIGMVKVINLFPAMERTAYLVILVVGAKLMIEAMSIPGVDFNSSENAASWIFWGSMALSILSGLKPRRERRARKRYPTGSDVDAAQIVGSMGRLS